MEKVKELNCFDAVVQVLRKTFVYKGRARRMEFWSWTLLQGFFYMMCRLFLSSESYQNMLFNQQYLPLYLLILLSLLLYIPTISVAIRRLHDINRSGWWYGAFVIVNIIMFLVLFFAIVFSPKIYVVSSFVYVIYLLFALVYSILLIVWNFFEGTHGPNKYGEDPKYEVIEDETTHK